MYDYLATILFGNRKVSKILGNYPIKHIHSWKVIVISVPMWEKFRVKEILSFAKD